MFSVWHIIGVQHFPQVLGCVTAAACIKGGFAGLCSAVPPPIPPLCSQQRRIPSPWILIHPYVPCASASPVPLEVRLSCRCRYLVFKNDSSFLTCTQSPGGCVCLTSRMLTGLTPAFLTGQRAVTMRFLCNVGFPPGTLELLTHSSIAEDCSCTCIQ